MTRQERDVAATHVLVTHADPEEYARIWNEGYEAAVAQGLADDPTLAGDWLAEHDASIKAEALPVEAPVEFAQTVIYHQRRTEGEDGCTECGPLPVGASFADHLWAVYRADRIGGDRG